MFEFEKLCHQYEKMTYDERRGLLAELYETINTAIYDIPMGIVGFEILVLAACSADGKLSTEEYALFKDSTGLDLSFDKSQELVKSLDGKSVREEADAIVDVFGTLDPGIKVAMVCFCLCICSADNYISLKESMFIKKLIKE